MWYWGRGHTTPLGRIPKPGVWGHILVILADHKWCSQKQGLGAAAQWPSFQDRQIWVGLKGRPWCTGCWRKVVAQLEGEWSHLWHKLQNEPEPKRWLDTIDSIRLGSENITMTSLELSRCWKRPTSPALHGTEPHTQSAWHRQGGLVLH